MTLRVDVGLARGDFSLDAAFEVAADETVALLGPNGSGKSTLVAVVAGLLPPDRGQVTLGGRPLRTASDRPAKEGRPVGVVFQDLLLFPNMSAMENVAFPLRARGLPKGPARRRAREMLSRFEVDARADARPRDLSGGEAQRVALARALIAEPGLLLLDEPTSSLDVSARAQLRPLLAETLRAFSGVCILVTHDPIEAMTLADRIVILERGRVTQAGTPEQLRRTPRTPYAADVVGVNLFSGRLERLSDGTCRLATTQGDLTVAWQMQDSRAVDAVHGIVRPADVTLHRARPEGSARNVVRGRVAEIAVEGERARVRLDARPPLVAEITLGSVERLGLREGATAWASFKAVEVRLVLPFEVSPGTLTR